TLSDGGGSGERAPSRRYGVKPGPKRGRHCRTRMGILRAAEPKSVFVFRQISARGTRTHRTSDRLGDPGFVCPALSARAVILPGAPGSWVGASRKHWPE